MVSGKVAAIGDNYMTFVKNQGYLGGPEIRQDHAIWDMGHSKNSRVPGHGKSMIFGKKA